MRRWLEVCGLLLVGGSCTEARMDLTERPPTDSTHASLTVDVFFSPEARGDGPTTAVLGSGTAARIQPLDALGRTVFENPGVAPYVVTISTSRNSLWTKAGVHSDRVRFVDRRRAPAEAPYVVDGWVRGAVPGDIVHLALLDDGERLFTYDVLIDPNNGAFTFKVGSTPIHAGSVQVAATATRDGVAVANGIVTIENALGPRETRRVEVMLDYRLTRTADLVVEGVTPGLTGANIRVGFGVTGLIDYGPYFPEPHDYRAIPPIEILYGATTARFETAGSLDGTAPRRRQFGEWPVFGSVDSETVELLPLPYLPVDVGSLASAVAYELDISPIRYFLPPSSRGTLFITEVEPGVHWNQPPDCAPFRWRVELDREGSAVEIPTFPVDFGFAAVPRGVPLTFELEAVDPAPIGRRVSATSGVVVLGDGPDCGDRAPLPGWAVGSFEANPAQFCGSFATRFYISACGDWRWFLPDTDLSRSGCGRLTRASPDELVFTGGPSGEFVLRRDDIARNPKVREPDPSFARIRSIEAATFPVEIVGRWIVDRATSRVVQLPPGTPVAGEAITDLLEPSNLGVFELDHRGQLFASNSDDHDRRGIIEQWVGSTGTIRYTNGAGMCSTIDRTAKLARIDDDHLELFTIEQFVDTFDRNGDGNTDELIGVERRLELVRLMR